MECEIGNLIVPCKVPWNRLRIGNLAVIMIMGTR